MKIQTNASGTRQVLDKLKLNVRSLLEGQAGSDKALLDLCLDVIYHPNMKAFGLQQLVLLYINWKNREVNGESQEVKSE